MSTLSTFVRRGREFAKVTTLENLVDFLVKNFLVLSTNMLRVTMVRALSRIKLEPTILTWIRGHSIKGGPGAAEEELEEAGGRVMVKFEDLPKRQDSERLAAFRKKMKEDMAAAELNSQGDHTDAQYHKLAFNSVNPNPQEDDPLPPWPNNTNPHTGEVGGPKGPEPTRYGDWERKGICVDF